MGPSDSSARRHGIGNAQPNPKMRGGLSFHVLLFLALIAAIGMVLVTANGGPVYLDNTNCSDTLSSSGTYILSSNMSCDGTALAISANGIILDCGGFTINYSKNETGFGVNLTGGFTGSTVKNCNILQSNGSVADSEAIHLNGNCLYSNITNNNLTTYGANSHGINSFSWSNNSVIASNSIIAYGTQSRGIWIFQTQNLTISDNSITTNNSFGVTLDSSPSNYISYNNITTNGSGGIDMRGSPNSGIDIISNTIHTSIIDGYGSGISISDTASDIDIINNTISTTAINSWAGGIITNSVSSSDSRIIGNTINLTDITENNSMYWIRGIWLQGTTSNVNVTDNTVNVIRTVNSSYGIQINSGLNSIISDNVVSADATSNFAGGLNIGGSNVNITNNNITARGSNGIASAQNSAYLIISGNNVTTYGGNAFAASIQPYSSNNSISDNTLTTYGSSSAVLVNNATGNNITNNNMTGFGNNTSLINMAPGSRLNRVLSNTLIGYGRNNTGGVRIDSGNGNNVSNNTLVMAGSFTAALRPANTASNNTFINNTITLNGNNSVALRSGESAHHNTFIGNNVTINNDSSAGIRAGNVNGQINHNNTYTDNLVIVNAPNSFGARFTNGATGNSMYNNTINLTASGANFIATDSTSAGNNMTNTTLMNGNGSVRFGDLVIIPANAGANDSNLNISYNLVYLNGSDGNVSFLASQPAELKFLGLNSTSHRAIYDPEDDGTFADCPGGVCAVISDIGGTFVYNVTGFTAYSSMEGTLSVPDICGNLNQSNTAYNMTHNVNSTGTCFTIGTENVTLDCNGFTINGSGSGNGIGNTAGYDNITIKNCNIAGFYNGIDFENDSNYNSIENNTVSSSTIHGIYFQQNSDSSTIANNTIRSSGYYGIYLESGSDNNTITNNTASSNYYAVYVHSSSNNDMSDNNFSSNSRGVFLQLSSNNTLTNNNVSSNSYYGIITNNNFDPSSTINNTFVNNTVSSNGWIGFSLGSNLNTLINNTVSLNSNTGIALGGANNNLTGNTVNSNGIGISFFGNGCSDNTLSNNTIGNSSTFGIDLEGGPRNIFFNNTITTTPGSYQQGLFVSGASIEYFHHNITTDNTIDGAPVYYYDSYYGSCPDNATQTFGSNISWLGLAGCANATVNAASDADHVLLAFTSDSTVTGINVSDSQRGFYIYYSSGNHLTNNTARSIYYNGFDLEYSSDNLLANNNASSNNGIGIWVQYGSSNTLDGNTADSNYIGIVFQYNSNNTIANNTVSNGTYIFGGHGISLYQSSNNSIRGNTVRNNTRGNGIALSSSHNNTVANNTARSNQNGISISGSNSNAVANNTVSSNNNYGILLSSSSSNTIYNNLFNNSANAYADSTNSWNVSIAAGTNIASGNWIGGNFYADSIGNGFSDTCVSDSNLFCTSQYNITNDGNNIDLLPIGLLVNHPPDVAITSPTNGATLTSRTIAISGTATDTNLNYTDISILQGSTLISSTTSTSSSFSASLTVSADGAYTIRATSYDLDSNNASASVNVTVSAAAGTPGYYPSTDGCSPVWSCTGWGECNFLGTKMRECTDTNGCGTLDYKPLESQLCGAPETPICEPNWVCADYGLCAQSNMQSRNCTDYNRCGIVEDMPKKTRSCFYLDPDLIPTSGKERAAVLLAQVKIGEANEALNAGDNEAAVGFLKEAADSTDEVISAAATEKNAVVTGVLLNAILDDAAILISRNAYTGALEVILKVSDTNRKVAAADGSIASGIVLDVIGQADALIAKGRIEEGGRALSSAQLAAASVISYSLDIMDELELHGIDPANTLGFDELSVTMFGAIASESQSDKAGRMIANAIASSDDSARVKELADAEALIKDALSAIPEIRKVTIRSAESKTAIELVDSLMLQATTDAIRSALGDIRAKIAAGGGVDVQKDLVSFRVTNRELTDNVIDRSWIRIRLNAPKQLDNLTIIEYIPKRIAPYADDAVFAGKRPAVIESDPIVAWTFSRVTWNEMKDISYVVSVSMDDLDSITLAAGQPSIAPSFGPPEYIEITYPTRTLPLRIGVAIITIIAYILFLRSNVQERSLIERIEEDIKKAKEMETEPFDKIWEEVKGSKGPE